MSIGEVKLAPKFELSGLVEAKPEVGVA